MIDRDSPNWQAAWDNNYMVSRGATVQWWHGVGGFIDYRCAIPRVIRVVCAVIKLNNLRMPRKYVLLHAAGIVKIMFIQTIFLIMSRRTATRTRSPGGTPRWTTCSTSASTAGSATAPIPTSASWWCPSGGTTPSTPCTDTVRLAVAVKPACEY